MTGSRSTIGLVTSIALASCFKPGGLDETTGTTAAEGGSSTTGATATTLTDDSGPVTMGEVSTTGDGPTTTTGGTSSTGSTGSTGSVTDTSDDGTGSSSTGTTTLPLVCGDGLVHPGEQCDDGNFEGGDGCSATCERDALIVFLSSTQSGGGFGGSALADAACQSLATVAGLPGGYVAWISDGKRAPALARIGDSQGLPYILANGTPLAPDTAGLVDKMLDAPINITETGDSIDVLAGECMGVINNVWTGTDGGGVAITPNCNDWSTASDQVMGIVGRFTAVDGAWSDAMCAQTCDQLLRFYCVGVPPP